MSKKYSSQSLYNKRLKERLKRKTRLKAKSNIEKPGKTNKNVIENYNNVFPKYRDVHHRKKFFIKPQEHLWHIPALCNKDHSKGENSEYVLHGKSHLEYYKGYMSYIKAFNKAALNRLTNKKE